jgi:hypothetical protein
MTVFAKPAEIPRDRWGRPMVVPPTGGKRVPYTRCTTFVGAVEDTYNLSRWQMRMVATGMADRRDLQLAVAAHREDKEKLNAICEQALEAAKGNAGATTGTALHAITETYDRGLDPGPLPPEAQADLDAYVAATKDMSGVLIEQFMVQDMMKVGGTPDRVVKFQGKRYIADLKTGSIEYGYLKIAAQLAMYARSRPYDTETDERMEQHGADISRGIVIHLPAGTGTCQLYWIDLMAGWELVKLSRTLRQQRAMSFAQFLQPVTATPPADVPLTLADQIRLTVTPDQVRALWHDHASEWTDDLTELAKQHLAELAVRGGQPVVESPAHATPNEGVSA